MLALCANMTVTWTTIRLARRTAERFPSHSKYCGGKWMPHTVAFCIDSRCLTQCTIFIWIYSFFSRFFCVQFRVFPFSRFVFLFIFLFFISMLCLCPLYASRGIRKIWLGVNICCHLSHLLNGSILAHLKRVQNKRTLYGWDRRASFDKVTNENKI